MRGAIFAAAAAAVILQLAAAGVVEITEDNFDDVVDAAPHMMLFFYAPWCGHCSEMKPQYEAAADTLERDAVDVTMARVDATVHVDIAAEHQLTGYPTLKWFEDGVSTTYEGDRRAESIISWIKKHMGAGALRLKTKEEVYQFKSDNEVSVVGYFKADEIAEGGASYTAFSSLALDSVQVPMAVSSVWTEGVDTPRVVLYKHFDEGEAVLSSGLEKDLGGGPTLTPLTIVQFVELESAHTSFKLRL